MCSLDGSFEGSLDSDDEPNARRLLALLLLPIAYGSIHLTAWGYALPSLAESLCWNAAGSIIMACSLLELFIFLV